MSYIPVSRRTIRRHRESEGSTRRLVVALSAAAAVAWLLSVTLSAAVHTDTLVHNYAVVLHCCSWWRPLARSSWWTGTVSVARRQAGTSEILRLDGAATPLIRGGLAGMLATGVFLNPHLSNPMTDVKLAAVLVLSLNGTMLIPLMRRLARLSFRCLLRGPDRRAADPPGAVHGHLAGLLVDGDHHRFHHAES